MKVAAISMATLLAGATIVTLSLNMVLSLAGAIVLAIGMGIANAAVFKLVTTYVPEAIGGAAGWVGGLGAFGGIAIPPFICLLTVYRLHRSHAGEPGVVAGCSGSGS